MWRFQHGLTRPTTVSLSSTAGNNLLSRSLALAATTQAMTSREEPAQSQTGPCNGQPDYSKWDTSSLIARISELERQLPSQTVRLASSSSRAAKNDSIPIEASPSSTVPLSSISSAPGTRTKDPPAADFTQTQAPGRPPKLAREIDPSKYHTRFIALKFAYLGQRYNGYEHSNGNYTPLPTVEEELWKALRRTRLIIQPATNSSSDDPTATGPRPSKPYSISWDGCQYSKAGRTDRGVSAFGQVIGIRVRSARPKPPAESKEEGRQSSWDDVADELPYMQILNRVLPEDIRMLAWCPQPPPNFDARFSCRGRHYKYFFTQPAFAPTPGPLGFAEGSRNTKYREGWLDIDAMRKAAKYFEGVHDFRNFCKVDTSKQLDHFERIIYQADIETVDPHTHKPSYVGGPGFEAFEGAYSTAQVYAFNLRGSAFLWHQVRHMIGVLFLIGQGFESPSIIPDLLDISKNPRRPTYEMASDAPLVLWDCIFPGKGSQSPEDGVEWIYAGDTRMSRSRGTKFGVGGVVDDLWTVWRQRKMDEILASSLLDLAVGQGEQDRNQPDMTAAVRQSRGQKIFFGGNEGKLGGKYVQVMHKRKMDPVEVQNARYRASKKGRKTTESVVGAPS